MPWLLAAAAALLLALGVVWSLARRHPEPPAAAPGPAVVVAPVLIAPAPPTTAPASPIAPIATESSLLLPLELKLADLRPLVEAGVPRKFDQTLELGSHGPAKDVRAVLDLVRGDVTLVPEGERLAFSFPLTGRIPVKATIDPGFAARESIDNVRGVVSGWIKLGVDANWNLTHESDAAMRVDKAEVKFPLLTLSVRKPLEEQTKAALSKVLKETLESAAGKLKLRDRAGDVWSRLHTAHAVSETPRAAVSFEPLAIRMRPLRFDDDGVARLALSVSGRTTTYLAAEAPQSQRTALPDLVADATLDNRFHVVLPVGVRASDLALSSRPPIASPGGVSFTPKQVRWSLLNEQAHLKIDFEAARANPQAAARGTLYVAGRHAYDPLARALRVEQARYDPQTQAALAAAADWLLDPVVLESVARSCVFPLDAVLRDADATAGAQVARVKAPGGIDLGLVPAETRLREVRAGGEWVYLLFDVKGTSRATVPTPLRR